MSRLIRMVVVVLLAGGLSTVATSSASASTLQSGVVTTGDGSPLAGATVAVFDESGKGIAGATTTASDGTYTLEDCPSCVGQVVASAEGYASARGSGPDYTLFALARPYVGWASTTMLTFAWDAVPGAVAYRITFAAEHTFKNPTIISPATKTVHTFKQLLRNHLYYLHVYPIDADSHVIRPDVWLGDDNRPTAGRTGYVNYLHATNRTSTSLTFEWAPFLFANGTEYEVQLSKSPTFGAFRTKWSLHSNDTLAFGNLAPGTTYYARVRARNHSHTYTTPWSGAKVASTL